jgi:hypothetical protein
MQVDKNELAHTGREGYNGAEATKAISRGRGRRGGRAGRGATGGGRDPNAHGDSDVYRDGIRSNNSSSRGSGAAYGGRDTGNNSVGVGSRAVQSASDSAGEWKCDATADEYASPLMDGRAGDGRKEGKNGQRSNEHRRKIRIQS